MPCAGIHYQKSRSSIYVAFSRHSKSPQRNPLNMAQSAIRALSRGASQILNLQSIGFRGRTERLTAPLSTSLTY